MKKILKKIGLSIASIMMAMSLINITPIQAAGERTLTNSTNYSYDGEKIVNFARQWIGRIPYVWGGRNMTNPTTGLDCAGFVDYVYISLGYTDLQANLWGNNYKITDVGMTGTAWWDELMKQNNVTYAEGSVSTISTGNARPGDIVMYYDETGESYHMGIYSGNGKLIHECENLTTGAVYNVTESTLDTCVSKHNVSMKSIRIYRVVNSDPDFDTLSSTKTGTGKVEVNLTVNKTDVETKKPLSDVEFEFHRVIDGNDINLGKKKTNHDGIASIKSLITQDFSAKSSTYKFVSDWKGVSDSVKKVWLDNGYLDGSSESLKAKIQAQADQEANDKLDSQITAYESQNITYYALETNTKTKYWLNPETVKVSKTQNNSNDINWDMQNTRTKVTLELVKVDKDTNGRAQGDASLEGAKYALYAASPILDPADNSVIYDKDTKVLEVTTDKDGKASVQNLYLGEYYWKEIEAPQGYKLDQDNHHFEVKYTSQNVQIESHIETIKEDVITGQFEITKIITDGNKSEITRPEENAVFGVVLEKYVNQYGSVQEALNHKDEMSEKEYEIMTTDSNGHASSNDLAYGKYVVAQLENGAEEVELLNDSFTFEVSEVNQPIAYYVINNKPTEYQLLIEKVDLDTNQVVTLSSAKFKIKDSNDNYVSQKVGGRKYDTFVTNSDGQVGILTQIKQGLLGKEWRFEEDTKGTVITPLTLQAGTYTIEEVETPQGFLQLDSPIQFTIKASYVSEATEDGTPVIKVIVKNDQPTGKLIVNKSIEDYEADKTLIEKNLSGFEFSLYTKEDIVSPIGGSVLYEANSKYGSYTTDSKGTITVDNIPMGSYYLKETGTKPGFILNEDTTDVIFIQQDTTTKEYTISSNIENKTTKVEFSKKAVTGDEELEGAHLVIKNSNNEVVDEWDSDKKTHIIEGLEIGQTYTMIETISPDGYVKATTIEFKVSNTGEIQKVEMIDKVVTMSKEDVGGKELPGASIQVFDEDGKIVDEWTSTTEAHKIKGLEEGKKYILHEDVVPVGYALTTDIEFTVSKDKEDQHLVMTDKKVFIDKLDQFNYIVKGAKLQILDKNRTVIDEWVSGEEHSANNLKVGETYVLHEVSAPNNYKKAENIEFTVTNDRSDQFVKMVDLKTDEVSITKYDITNKEELPGAKLKLTDKDGNTIDEWTSTKETHIIKGLIIGDAYTLTEITSPKGYQIAESITFVVKDNGKVVQEIKMYDKPTSPTPNTGVAGANPIYFVTATISGVVAILLLRKRKQTK